MNKEKNSIYEAISLQEDVLKTTMKEDSSRQTTEETFLWTSEGFIKEGERVSTVLLPP